MLYKNYIESEISVSNDLENCIIKELVITNESCFNFNSETETIIRYYKNENNDENQLMSVIIPFNVTIQSNSISSSFYTTYVTNKNKAGGIYTSPSQDGTWTKQ